MLDMDSRRKVLLPVLLPSFLADLLTELLAGTVSEVARLWLSTSFSSGFPCASNQENGSQSVVQTDKCLMCRTDRQTESSTYLAVYHAHPSSCKPVQNHTTSSRDTSEWSAAVRRLQSKSHSRIVSRASAYASTAKSVRVLNGLTSRLLPEFPLLSAILFETKNGLLWTGRQHAKRHSGSKVQLVHYVLWLLEQCQWGLQRAEHEQLVFPSRRDEDLPAEPALAVLLLLPALPLQLSLLQLPHSQSESLTPWPSWCVEWTPANG